MRITMTTQATVRRFDVGTDSYGNTVRTGEVTDTEILCWVSPNDSDEEQANRDQVERLFKIFIDGEADVTHRDQIITDGLTLEVMGAPFKYRDRRGVVHHLEAIGRIVEG